MTINDLLQGATIDGMRVTSAGAICMYCENYASTLEEAKEHDGICQQHPMFAEVLRLRAQVKVLELTIEGLTK